MATRIRFVLWCVLALVMVVAVACGHGPTGRDLEPPLGAQAAKLGWPVRPVIASGKVGTLPGAGNVGPAGDYHYRLPIEVPPGRAGMTPSLALAYSSAAGNGALGVGWALEGGLSLLGDCNKTFAVDGVAENGAGLCLDGEKLVEVAPNDYRTLSSGFARVSRISSSEFPWDGYRVELQDGRVRSYLSYALDYNLQEKTKGGGTLYALTREQDRDGNEIRYFYDTVTSDYKNGAFDNSVPYEIYLSEIDYGAGPAQGAQGPALPSALSRKIVFDYDPQRPDPIEGDQARVLYKVSAQNYRHGLSRRLDSSTRATAIKRLLRSIRCFAPGAAAATQQSSLAWTYQLTYGQSTGSGRSLLRSVTRVGALGGTIYAKEFSWEQTKGGTFTNATGAALPSFGDPDLEITSLDVDNDGKDELLVAMPAGGIPTPILYETEASGPVLGHVRMLPGLAKATLTDARVADLDGDGVPEILAPDRAVDATGTAAYGLYTWSNALADYLPTTPPVPFWGDYKNLLSSGAEQPIFLADFDGDGLPDLVQARHQHILDPTCEETPAAGRPKCLAYTWYYSHNTGGGTFNPRYVDGEQDLPIFTSEPAKEVYYAPFSGSPFAALSTADEAGRAHLFAAAVHSSSFTGPLMMAELPGDDSPIGWNGSLPNASLCGLGDFRGRGSYQVECFDPGSVDPVLPGAPWRITTFDVDGDGRDDLLAYNFGTDDSGHFHVLGGSYRISYDSAGARHQDAITQVPLIGGDFDGDGIQDAYLYDRATETSYVGLQTTPTRDRMDAVADETHGDRPAEKVMYSQRWSADPVAPMACRHPQRCLRRGMSVVLEHDVYQGADVDEYEHHLYSYDDPRTDVQGGGFLGFATVRVWNPDRPSETITTYDNAPTATPGVYRAFLPTGERTFVPVDPIDSASKRTVAEPLRVRIAETTSHYAPRFPFGSAGKTHFVYRDAWTEAEWESGAMLDWSPARRIAHHFTGTSAPPPALRVRHGLRSVNDYDHETHSTISTEGGNSVEVRTEYEQETPQAFYLDRVKTRRTTVTGATSAATPAPRRVDYAYDPAGHLASMSVEATLQNDPDVQSKVEFDYTNGHGLVTTITKTAPGEAPRHTYIAYDPEEGIFPRKTWNDLGHTAWSLYHPAFGVLSDYVDVNGVETQVRLDDFGRIVQTARAGEPATAVNTAYQARTNDKGHLIGTTVETFGEGLVRTLVTLDSLGRVVLDEHTGLDGRPIVRQTDYDTLGRVVATRRPISLLPGQLYLPAQEATSYTYDPLDRLRRVVAPDQSTVTHTPTFWRTDTVGPVPASPVPGFVASRSYVERDVEGRVVTSAQVSSTGDVTTTFVYGDFNELRTVTDPTTKNVTTMEYDQLGRRTGLTDPDTGTSTSHYNGFGELTRVEVRSIDGTPGPSSTRYYHDALGRLLATENADGTTKFTWDTSPNGVGQLASQSSPDGTREAFAYDALGQLVKQAWDVPRAPLPAESFEVGLEYDASGRLSTLTYPEVPGRPARFKVQQSYVNGYLKQIGPYVPSGQPTPTPFWSVDARNADDRLVAGTAGNGVTESRTYEPATGRLATILAGSNASPIPALSLAYAYWPDGAVKSRVDSARKRSETFEYDDGLSRLTGWHLTHAGATQDVSYHYDPIGNLDQIMTNHVVTETNTADPTRPHALATTVQPGVTRAFMYDARGRQTSTPDRQVLFTERNLPKAITTAEGTTTFLYDTTGQRVKKRTANGESETVSLGGLYERRRAGATIQHIFYVHGTEGHLAQITYDETTKAESRAYVHPDALGSASAITDDNKVVTRFDHEPFGKRIEPSGKDFTGGFTGVALGFTGQRMDDDLGLVNLTGRIYDPTQRRFLSPDPFVPRPLNAQSYNRFSYVYNDPLNLIDPSGFTGSEGAGTTCDPTLANCPPAQDYSGGPDSYATFEDNPNAATCGGTIHPCPTPAPEKVGPTTSVASKFHVTIVPVVGTGGDKWNPHTPEGRIQKELFGSDPAIDYLAATQPSPEVTRAMLGFVPGLNSALVFGDPKATTFDKTLAVGTDVLAVVGVGTVFKLGAKGVGLAKGVVLGAEVVGEAAAVEGVSEGATVLRELRWSSKSLREAASALEMGSKEITVASRAEAEELFLGKYQARGYRNTTGWSPKNSRNFFGTKLGTYHWDEGANAFPHDASHLQLHTFEREVIRIYFP
jgi:RHS repeat-associated protein